MSTNPPRSDADNEGGDAPGPQNLIPSKRLEQGVIADCIIADHMPGEVPFLRPEHFYTETDRAAWQGLIELEALGCKGDVETLINHLKRTAHVKDVDWGYHIPHICNDDFPLNQFNFEHDARELYDYALRRQRVRELEQQEGELARQARDLFDVTVPLPESGLDTTADDVHSAAEAFEDLPPVEWLVHKIFAPGSVVLLYGKPGTKKTYSMMHLQACLAPGRDFHGFATRQANSLLLDQESGHLRIQQRMRECLNGVGGDKTALIYWLTMKGYKLSNPAHVTKIIEHCRKHHIKILIVDSLSKHSVGDENSAGEMAKEMEGARRIATETGAVVILIHHSKKEGEEFRGSSAIEGSVDVMIRVESEQGSPFIHFKMEKNRDGELLEWWAKADWFTDEDAPGNNRFTMERVEGKREQGGEKREPTLNQAEQYIVQYLREHGECTRAEIMKGADPTKQRSVSNGLYALLGKGMVMRANPEEKGQYAARFALTDESGEDEDDL
jgi:hypothetical protein